MFPVRMQKNVAHAFRYDPRINAIKHAIYVGLGMWHVWGEREMNTEVRWEDVKERDHLEDLGVGRRIILKCYKIRWEGVYWINWLRIGRYGWLTKDGNESSGAGNFLTSWWTVRFLRTSLHGIDWFTSTARSAKYVYTVKYSLALFASFMSAAYLAHSIFLDFVIVILFGKS